MTEIRPGLNTTPENKFNNKHQNFEFDFVNPRSYVLSNPRIPNGGTIGRYRQSTKNLMRVIQEALQNDQQITPTGSKWSFSEIMRGRNGIIHTHPLNFSVPLSESQIHPDFKAKGNTHEDVYFVQCGTSIREINARLSQMRPARSIIASGASNGQTIAGATSTGTHGAAFKVGAVHDAILGLHIICGKDRHVYIQKQTERVVSDRFVETLQVPTVNHIINDDVFNAAINGLGAFGIIHGILIKTEPIFLLEKHLERKSYDTTLKHVMDTLDFSSISLNPPENDQGDLYHFEVKINPYQTDPGQLGAYITYMYKLPYQDIERRTLDDRGYTYGDDTLGAIDKLIKIINTFSPFNKWAVKTAVSLIMNGQFNPDDNYPWLGTIGDTFTYTSLKGKAASCAIAIDHSVTSRVVDMIIKHIDTVELFLGVIAIRYVKGTNATLGFTKFPITSVIELDGIDSNTTRTFYNNVCQLLTDNNIKFTLHWGKINDYLQNNPIDQFYKQSRIDSWQDARAIVFNNDKKVMRIFENNFLRNCQLA